MPAKYRPPTTPAPAFSAWAKQQEQEEFARGRVACEQFAGLCVEAGALGYFLCRHTHTDRYQLYVAETSVRHPKKPGDLHFTRYVVEFDVHRQRVKLDMKTNDRPPAVVLNKPWTLETAVRAYIAAIAQEQRHVPQLGQEAADQPPG